MCGKFTQHSTWDQVHAFSKPLIIEKPEELVVSTPMRPAYIMRLDPSGQRVMVPMRWGFSGVNDKPPSKPRHIHARGETIDTLRTFARAFQETRGILMVATFNEGEEVGKRTKQWTITPNDRLPIAIAVICERWTNGADVLDTFVMVTTPSNTLISRITDRMPAILPRETWPVWLGGADVRLADAKALLQTSEDGGNWTMEPQATIRPARPPRPPKLKSQGELF
jgi:putative SOS response-associated peptidase YedK